MQGESGKQEKMVEFARQLFIQLIAEGKPVDVTHEVPELQALIEWAEREELIEIDVQKAAYKLTAKGKALHQAQLKEAQDLIRRYDIFGDVDIDASGTAYFDTGLGKDLRVPVFEVEGVDPFRARFLVGLNDGEFNDEDLAKVAFDIGWYDKIFAPIELAPTAEDIGEPRLMSVLDQGKARLRAESAHNI
jgi:hypothetical protein